MVREYLVGIERELRNRLWQLVLLLENCLRRFLGQESLPLTNRGTGDWTIWFHSSGKAESSELAERFCLRGRCSLAAGGKVFDVWSGAESRGTVGRSGAENVEVFVWSRGQAVFFFQDSTESIQTT